jgi:hypothetical protein
MLLYLVEEFVLYIFYYLQSAQIIRTNAQHINYDCIYIFLQADYAHMLLYICVTVLFYQICNIISVCHFLCAFINMQPPTCLLAGRSNSITFNMLEHSG